jgi:hypothetical protein
VNNNSSAKWNNWNSASAQRTWAHELGHLLGLGDYAVSCDSSGNGAVMQPNFACGPTASPVTTPTLNDSIPINNTVYGGYPRNTCGF